MHQITHIGQYWSAESREVRLLGVSADGAFDLTDAVDVARSRRRFRDVESRSFAEIGWTYSRLPFPVSELAEHLEARGVSVHDWARGGFDASNSAEVDFSSLDVVPSPDRDHLVAPILPRRALAFGVTYLNSALERETEGQRSDYGYVYRAVKDRGQRPELFLKGTSPEHFVGPNGKMALRSDLTNSETIDGKPCEQLRVSCGIEPELALVSSSTGEIWGYTLANDVSGNRIENETLLYLTQAKYFTGALVLGPLILLSREQTNPCLEINTRIFSEGGEKIFERTSNTESINAPLCDLVGWASSHLQFAPGEVVSTGTDVVPDGDVKVLEPGMTVQIRSEQIGNLRHGAAYLSKEEALNLDYSRLELER